MTAQQNMKINLSLKEAESNGAHGDCQATLL